MYRPAHFSFGRAGLCGATAALLLTAGASASRAQDAASLPELRRAFDAAWQRQPEAQVRSQRLEALSALRRAAEQRTPEPPAIEAAAATDALTRPRGAREMEIGISVPLWLPGEQARSLAVADAEQALLDSRQLAARWRLAGELRSLWWNWQRALVDTDTARVRLTNAQRIAADVVRRVRAGDLARADQHQADGAVAAAELAVAQADSALASAAQALHRLSGTLPGTALADAEALPAVPTANDTHPALAEGLDRARAAELQAALVATRSRAHPELTVSAARDRGAVGEPYSHSLRLGIRISLGAGPRHDAQLATARADAIEAQARLVRQRDQLATEQAAAQARVQAARQQLAAAQTRARLAREARGFFDKSFQAGETDLPMRLRIEAEAAEAEQQAARSRIELAAAISEWRQALGLLPQ